MGKSPLLRWSLTVAALLGLGLGAYKYLSGDAVLAALQGSNLGYAVPVLMLGALYLVLKGWRFVVMLRPLHDLPVGVAFRAFVAGSGAALLPGGTAARLGIFKQVGVPISVTTAPLILSSLLDQVVFIVGALLVAIWFPEARGIALIIAGVIAALALSLWFHPVRTWVTGMLERLSRRFHFEEKWQGFTQAWKTMAHRRLLGQSLALTVMAFVLKLVALDLCLRGLDWHLPYLTLFASYMLPTLLGRLSPLPAGVGVTEAAMVTVLVASTQLTPEVAFAAVALFRIGTVFFDGLLGTLVYFFAWRGEREAVHTSA